METKALSDGIIKTVLWQEILRLAFSPVTKSEQISWLQNYYSSLRHIWGIETTNWKGKLCGFISHTTLNIKIDHSLDDPRKSTIVLTLDLKEFDLQHDTDTSYFFPIDQLCSFSPKHIRSSLNNFTEAHLRNVLAGMIFHPRAHQHLGEPFGHDIRIGGGIDNPFLYLFNLRYQLCPNTNARESEENRLARLFETKLHDLKTNPETTINAWELFFRK